MKTPSQQAETGSPTAADFYAKHNGGGLFSERVGQRIGARMALWAFRRRLAPTVITVAHLGVSCLVSFIVIAMAGPVAEGLVWAWPVGVLALVGWQFAYGLDCADGQLARVTGQSSPAGARINSLCDVAAQAALVAALSATAVAHVPSTPAWLVAAFVGTWMTNLVTSMPAAGPRAAMQIIKLLRDHGAVVLVAGLVLTIAPELTIYLVGFFTLVNAGFLAADIAISGREALKR